MVFCGLFAGSCLESRRDEVELKGFSLYVMQVLVDFAYSGVLSLTTDNVLAILEGSSRLQIARAIALCSEYLECHLSCETVVCYLNAAESFGLRKLQQLCLEFIAHHLLDLALSEDFVKDLEQDSILALLQRDDLNIPTEEDLFHLTLIWIQTKDLNPFQFLKHIRFGLMDPEKLVDEISISPVSVQSFIVLNHH